MGRRRYRRLLVGPDAYRWRVGHQHTRDGRRLLDCRETLLLRQEGRPGRINVVFREGPGRIVPDGGPYTHSGSVCRAEDETMLNLHRPRVVRALLDVALGRGEDFWSSAEIDGWTIIDAVYAHLAGKSRYLVQHDYGMGGLWWWVWADSAEEILDACAEVEVMDDPDVIRRVRSWGDMEEVVLDRLAPDSALAHLRDRRSSYRDDPGYGELAGHDVVHLRMPDEEDERVAWLMEIGRDGRWTRQVEIRPGEHPVRSSADDWPINPPLDLYDPRYLPYRISAAEFENAWEKARPEQ
ncbi:hypothetical protein [Actinomadura geliboluensis]|uniref:hypothetical protein n=1 Tax=Actinomadura geliboluensis TaxID=882440 RepID=UPI00371573B7